MSRLLLSVWMIAGLLTGVATRCPGDDAPRVRADRDPLTFRDAGLYGGPVADSPWTFYILQIHAPANKDEVGRAERKAQRLKGLAAEGTKVIGRLGIGRLDPDPDVDEMEERVARLFRVIDPDLFYAVTLDEENVYWNGYAEVLTELYRRMKARWPDLPVYQWWSPNKVPNARAKTGWVALPADGWVINPYGVARQEFEKKVVMALETGKPVIHIAWACPDWPAFSGAESWSAGGREVLDDQLAICQAYDIPVAYFCMQKYIEKDGKRVQPIRGAWAATNPSVRRWYDELACLVMNFRYLSADSIGFRLPLSQRKLDWAHRGPPPVEIAISLDQQGRKRFRWRSRLEGVPKQPGEHPVPTPYENPYMNVVCLLDATSSQLHSEFGLASRKGHVVKVPLVFRVVPRQPLTDIAFTANVLCQPDTGGAATLSFSSDGKHWSSPVTGEPDRSGQCLTIRGPGDQVGTTPFWCRVVLAGQAQVDTGIAARLNWVEVSAAFEHSSPSLPSDGQD